MKLAILGATGAVGLDIINCLKELDVQFSELRLLASPRSAGKKIETPYGAKEVEAVDEKSFDGCTWAFFAAGADRSKRYLPHAITAGCRVIDCSSAFRYDKDVPLIISEINASRAIGAKLIANPNCTTAIASVVLWPLHQVFKLKKIIISTYQASSGAGTTAMTELINGTTDYLQNKKPTNEIFSHPLPFNLIPRIDVLQENGYTKEEMKVVWELRKIFDDDSMGISCTCVRVPVLRSHSESITIETEKEIDTDRTRSILSKAVGVDLIDEPHNDKYPMPLTSSEKFNVEVGRIRQSLIFGKFGIDFFISGDQILKGSALNAVQILKYVLGEE
ncbi:MAG: aspartate-semialdehyde dehydrogenase [Pseudomonadota bacterium]